MPDDNYKPIACGDYDIYEIAIMKQRPLLLEWINPEGKAHRETVTPVALKIIDGAEYLLYEIADKMSQKMTGKRRLDKINSAKII